MRRLLGLGLLGALAAALPGVVAPDVAAQAVPAAVPGAARDAVLEARVLDAATGRPVPGATVRTAAGQGAAAGLDGVLRLALPPGEAVPLEARALGYAPEARTLGPAAAGDTLRHTFRLVAAGLAFDEVVVEGARADHAAAVVLQGEALRRRTAGSVAATIAGLPGVWQRYNGPVAAQPVLRGLTGDRVLVLEDGQRTGDIATTAPDHAVTADPLGAERIEVVRGPAGLLFGSATLGGVVNVVRGDVPDALPERLGVTARLQGETVNAGGAAGLVARGRAGRVSWRAEGLGRGGRDTRTPGGPLPYTDLRQTHVGAGASLVGARGHAGAAVREVRLRYGVPGTFGGVTLPGAHEGGVYVDLTRRSARAETLVREAGPFARVRARAGYTWLLQEEYERGGFVGTRFGQLLTTADVVGYGAHGAVGVSALWRDWAAAGSYTGTRPAVQQRAAAFGYREWPLGTWGALGAVRAQAGLRADLLRVTPRDTAASRIAPGVTLGGIRERRFAALSGSASVLAAPAPGVTLGASLARSVRPPSEEELFSNGPHLATYAYEVGNPALGLETGWGAEVFSRLATRRVRAEAGLHASRVGGYIRYAPLLGPDGRPLPDYRLQRYDVYQARQADAAFVGAEGRAEVYLAPAWTLDVTAQALRAADLGSGEPLPFIPPAHVRAGLHFASGRVFAGAALDAAAAQRRVPAAPPALVPCLAGDAAGCPPALPGEFVPTPGRVLADAWAGARFEAAGGVHSLSLRLDNALDTAWRDPLSRVKSVAPQPGRNLSLLYRLDL